MTKDTVVSTAALQEAVALGLRLGKTDQSTQVHLASDAGGLRVVVSHLGNWYERKLVAQHSTQGKELDVSVPLRQFASVVAALHGESTVVSLATGGRRLGLESGAARFAVPVVDALFEAQPVACKADDLSPAWDKLTSGFARVLHAVGHDETRYTLCGVHLDRDGDKLALFASDGHRLSLTRVPYPAGLSLPEGQSVIVSGDAARVLQACAQPEGRFAIDGSSIHYADETQSLVVRLIDGQSPDWRAVVPSDAIEQTVTTSAGSLIEAVEQAKAIGATGLRIATSKESGTLTLSATNIDTGDLVVTYQAAIDGKKAEGKFAVNPFYLRDACRAVPGDEVVLHLRSDLDPLVVLPAGEDVASAKVVCLVMPMRL
jgi:DNA polymerase-3 subunit beta